MDAVSSVAADLVLVALSAPRSRPPPAHSRGPGRRRSGRFVQLRKERCSFPERTGPPVGRRPLSTARSLPALFCRAGCRLQCTLQPLIEIRVPDVHVQSHLLTRRLFGRSLLHRELARTVCLARSVIAEEAVVSRRFIRILT
jgi:hypothetical protein